MVLGICVGGWNSCICQERLPWHAEEPTVAKQFGKVLLADLIHTVHIHCFFRLHRKLYKSQEALCKLSLSCFFRFSGSHDIWGKYYNNSVFLRVFRYQVYAFNDLDNLKILLHECKMSFNVLSYLEREKIWIDDLQN